MAQLPEPLNDLLEQLRVATEAYDVQRVQSIAEQLTAAIQEDVAVNPTRFVEELQQAVDSYDRPRVEELCAQLVAHLRTRAKPYPLAPAKKILEMLRRKRHFELMASVADTLIQTGQDRPRIRRQYAQALIDQGYLVAGRDVLIALEQDCLAAKDEKELAEARGLLGRARKQMYVDAPERPGRAPGQILQAAIGSYAGEWKRTGKLWHGINTVALVHRAGRDRVPVSKSVPSSVDAAKRILREVSANERASLWDFATAGEACLALDDPTGALGWLVKYTAAEDTDAFEIASTLRQLEEVWQLDGTDDDHAKILHLLRATLLRKEGGRVEFDSPRDDHVAVQQLVADSDFEKVLGADRFKTFDWYRRGLDRASGVAKITDLNGTGHGSGFLMRAADVHPGISAPWVVVTNAHVVSEDPAELQARRAALPPDEIRIRFEASADPTAEFKAGAVVFSSPRHELDCTILALPEAPALEHPYQLAKRLPQPDRNQRVYVIGHPRGGGLSFSIEDNLLLDHEAPRVHYRAPTEGGSSGSPVFNQQWELIALHHAGGSRMRQLNGKRGVYPANEGLAFGSILQQVRKRLG